MSYSDFLSKMQQAILSDDERTTPIFLQSISEPALHSKNDAFGVYYNGYRRRLAEFLSNDYPVLRNILGDESFGSLVENYINICPSKNYNARWYSSGLVDFMRNHAPWREERVAIDVAQFEKCLADSFDAKDVECLNILALQQIDPHEWPELRFRFHPSVFLHKLAAETATIYESHGENLHENTINITDSEGVIFWRKNNKCFYRQVNDIEYLSLREAFSEMKFKDLCSMVSYQQNCNDIEGFMSSLLVQWFNDSIIIEIIL